MTIELVTQSENTLASHKRIKAARDELIWERMASIPLIELANEWLSTLARLTAINYTSALKKLEEFKVIDLSMQLQTFTMCNLNNVLDGIKRIDCWSECSKQARCAAFISFTKYLARKFPAHLTSAEPRRDANKTFYKVREKVATEALTKPEWTAFLSELEKINYRS